MRKPQRSPIGGAWQKLGEMPSKGPKYIPFEIEVDGGGDKRARLLITEDDLNLLSVIRCDTPADAVKRIGRLTEIGASVIRMISHLRARELTDAE